MSYKKRKISYEDFFEVVQRDCRAISGYARPAEGEEAHQYDCRLEDFVRNPVYPTWFVNDTRTAFRSYQQPDAIAIRVEELAALAPLVRSMLEGWNNPTASHITEASVIVLYCTGCERRVLVDGIHRTVLLLSRGDTAATVHVSELSGSRWPIDTPDLNVVCTCHRSGR